MRYRVYNNSKTFEDKYILGRLDEIFKSKRGHLFNMPHSQNNVILLVSGGLDSICLWNYLMGKYNLVVYPIHFSSNQINIEEQTKSLNIFSELFRKLYPSNFRDVYTIDYFPIFSFNKIPSRSQIMKDLSLVAPNLLYDKNKYGVVTLINNPSRLGIFAFRSFEYALFLRFNKNIPIESIFIAILPEDSNMLRESTLTVLRSINLSLCLVIGNFNWQFMAPIDKQSGFYLTKKMLVKYAIQKNLPLEKTWSCHQKKTHCGKCFNCLERKKIFQNLHYTDLTRYNKKTYIQSLAGKFHSKLSNILFPHHPNSNIIESNQQHLKGRLDLTKYFSISSKTIWVEIDKNINILNSTTGDFEILNDSASSIWKLLIVKPRKIDEITKIVAQHYTRKYDNIYYDVKKFLSLYLRRGYIIQGVDSIS